MAIRVGVLSRNPVLSEAISWVLGGDPALRPVPFPGDEAPDVVVATPDACSPCHCAELTRDSLRVILLCALPTPRQEAAYRSAGASAYLPMTGGLGALREALVTACTVPPPPEAPSAAFNQA